MHSLLIPYANWVHSPINSMHVNMFYHRISVLNSAWIFLTNIYQWKKLLTKLMLRRISVRRRIWAKGSDNVRKNPTKKNCENVQKKLFWQMQKILYVYIPPKKFHIIFLRKFSHAFSQFHQKSRFIGYLLHSSCYFIEYYYYYYHQKKKFFLGTSHSHSKCVAWFVSLLCSDSIERLTVFTQSCLKHLCISL